MNESNKTRGSAGINILWPDTNNDAFLKHLEIAEQGGNSNNTCPIIKYSVKDGAIVIWMGDLESAIMEEIVDEVELPKTDILFAPHHGRKSGHVPEKWLDIMEPKIVVVGEAPSEDLNYYSGYNTITQNSAGDIEFDCDTGKVHVRVSSSSYEASFLQDMGASSRRKSDGECVWYIGSFKTHKQP